MSPRLATVVFVAGILGLFYLDRDRLARTSRALWIPAIWIFIGASRMLSQWLNLGEPLDTPDAYLEGSPLDRAVLSGLLIVGIVILIRRWERTWGILRSNLPLILFLLYCGMSAAWSDYPFVAFKRWTKTLGNVTMVLLILSDANPIAAMKRVFARTGFFLIPLSVLFIKYYPQLGRGYSRWTWQPFYTGVTTEKNALGAICLVFGLASAWRFIDAFRRNEGSTRRGQLIAHGTVIVMAMWLFTMADSSTSLACFILGTAIMLLMRAIGTRRALTVHLIVGTVVAIGLFAFFFLDAYASIVEALGRDATLTGRTELWEELLQMGTRPWLGTGFETFWLGERAEYFWEKYYFHPNQAHNGYIETYLNLGWIGVGLLGVLMATGYRNVTRAFRTDVGSASLRLAYFTVAALYSVTEAAFKVMHPVWIVFLIAVTALPEIADAREEAMPTGEPVTPVRVPISWRPTRAARSIAAVPRKFGSESR
jgi:O-antigen ligase